MNLNKEIYDNLLSKKVESTDQRFESEQTDTSVTKGETEKSSKGYKESRPSKMLKYYDMSNKNLFDADAQKHVQNECALENDPDFVKKVEDSNAAMKKLIFVCMVCFFFMICEFVGGIWSGSLAIMTDAAHMFSDVAGFLISFISIYISQRKANFQYSYGYHRAEILGALSSVFLIWALLIWLNYEATMRIINPPEKIDANVMLITAIIGFACNIINLT